MMKILGKPIWILNVYTWAGMSIGASHWYWDLENTETRESWGRSENSLSDDEEWKGSCLLREDAVLEGTREFLGKTTQGVQGSLFIANRVAVYHGITIEESWQNDSPAS